MGKGKQTLIIEYLEQWKANGGITTFYTCEHCHEIVEIPQPTPELVSDKGFWDSATECQHCGLLNFVSVWPDGRTKVREIPDYHYSAKEGQEGEKEK